MLSQEIRRKFLQYFKEKGHSIIPSSPVVPHDDPTLLFNNAGMNQFKDVFLGKSSREYTKATSSQKCIRVGGKHNDLDNVGHTSRHLTFFEMLGNFSFGDYFKEKAIEYAWEVTKTIFKFSPKNIWITVFEKDEDSYAIWQKFVPKERIVKMGEKENFWAMGDTGPCGPCSELLYDRGEKYGDAKNPKEDVSGERYLEFWNLVFMQYNRDQNGKIFPLPSKSIDTGAGLERIVSLKMEVDNVFRTDILFHLIKKIESISGKNYKEKGEYAPAFHVIADHMRSLAFAIADGVQPSNVDRGYVVRKLLRRAVRYGKILNLQEPFLARVLPALIEVMGEDYPELIKSQNRIAEILTLEEESFIRTLKRGGNILSSIIAKAFDKPLKQISGAEAFKLKDTYGFPLDEILLIARDYGLEVNIDAYQLLEERAKEKSRNAQTFGAQETGENLYKIFVKEQGACEFTGYSDTESESRITGLLKNGEFVDSLSEGEKGVILLDKTPFYAEKGGQVADTGTITHEKARFKVLDCQNPYPGIIAHIGIVDHGFFQIEEKVLARIDEARRKSIANHHTATHLLHWALQQILGNHIKQAGSLVEEKKLRFDFHHHKALSLSEIRQIEDLINEKVRENQRVNIYEIPYEEAQKDQEIKQFFGEKYGNRVRVIDIGYSKELCGGTHVHYVGSIGLFRIMDERSIGAGLRRIEACVGKVAEDFARINEDYALKAAAHLKSTLPQLPEKVVNLVDENNRLKMELRSAKRSFLKNLALELKEEIEEISQIPFLAKKVAIEMEELSLLAEELLVLAPSLVLILGVAMEGRCQIIARVTPDLVQRGIQAMAFIKEISPIIEGGGGGKADNAQAGGKNPKKMELAFEKAKECLIKLSV
ncbi:MAG: alanine--tRNA ligase [Chlamydiae bacterium]|nr:alanine--tRNA ligase [Chlamydiota bacterium]